LKDAPDGKECDELNDDDDDDEKRRYELRNPLEKFAHMFNSMCT